MMNNEQPPILEPGSEPPQPPVPPPLEPPGSPYPWILLGAVITLFIAVSLMSYFKADPIAQGFSKQKSALDKYIRTMDLPGGAKRDDLTTTEKELTPYVGLDKKHHVHPDAQRYHAIATYLDKGAISQGDADRLLTSTDVKSKAVGQALGPEKPTVAMLPSIDAALGKDSISTYVKEQAHSRAGQPLPKKKKDLVLLGMIAMGALGLLGLGLILFAAYLSGVSSGRLVPKGWPNIPLSHREADSMGMRAALVLLFGYGLNPGGFLPAPLSTIVTVGVFVVLLLIPILGHTIKWGQFFGERPTLSSLGSAFYAYIAQLPIVVAGLVIAVALMSVLPASNHPLSQELTDGKTPVILLVLGATVLAPFIEEIIFRGLICQALVKKFADPTKAILLSSFMFGAIHPQGIPMWIALASVGAVSCQLFRHTRCLWSSMLFHGLHNLVIVMLALQFG